MSDELTYRYLKPAELCIADAPTLISTVLGSCVSLVLHARKQGLSAICHALLPTGSCLESGYRFVDCSIEHMLSGMRERGLRPGDLEAKLFGGSDMFSFQGHPGRGTVGSQNIESAYAMIARHGLNLVASDVGGARGRKLILHSHTGDVFVKLLGVRATLLPDGGGAEGLLPEATSPRRKHGRPAVRSES